VKRNPLSLRAKAWFGTKVAAWAMFWALPVGAVGIGFVATMFLSLVGMGLLLVAAAPLVGMMNKRREEVEKWKTSPTPGLTIGTVAHELLESMMTDEPWEEPQSTSTTIQDTLF
jgi:vacuolar-type H+-ATPase subunit I/STV1